MPVVLFGTETTSGAVIHRQLAGVFVDQATNHLKILAALNRGQQRFGIGQRFQANACSDWYATRSRHTPKQLFTFLLQHRLVDQIQQIQRGIGGKITFSSCTPSAGRLNDGRHPGFWRRPTKDIMDPAPQYAARWQWRFHTGPQRHQFRQHDIGTSAFAMVAKACSRWLRAASAEGIGDITQASSQ